MKQCVLPCISHSEATTGFGRVCRPWYAMMEKNPDFEEAAWFARAHNANRLRQNAAAQDKAKRIAKKVNLSARNPRVRTVAAWTWCIAVDPCTVRRVFVKIGGSQLDITPFFGQTDHPVARWLSDRVKPHTLDSADLPGNDLICIPVGIAGIPAGLMPYMETTLVFELQPHKKNTGGFDVWMYTLNLPEGFSREDWEPTCVLGKLPRPITSASRPCNMLRTEGGACVNVADDVPLMPCPIWNSNFDKEALSHRVPSRT